uniref:LITAF domain-containing protein n=1 Tax=Grammatophora oceanica TaxID=210454 RepID=A0A7S1Y9N8_9STRA|mmetsp:Transcript_38796/g.57702  ORF Transcript_38796/g.57702 Transcript_38796/m.57702 type:complete len:152 (+) Transcript_38796:80-535(+)
MGVFGSNNQEARGQPLTQSYQNVPMVQAEAVPADEYVEETPSTKKNDAVNSATIAPPHPGRVEYFPHRYFHRIPARMETCPVCNVPSVTRVRTYPDFLTWILCIVLFVLFWPIFWIPLVCDSCKMTKHYCSQCNALVGEVRPFERCCETEA